MNLFEQLGNFFSSLREQGLYHIFTEKVIVLDQQGKLNEAIELAEQSLNLARNIWGNEHSNVASSLYNLGLLSYKKRKYNQA